MDFRYPKKEKLKSKKLIESLFSEGKSVGVFPLRLFYMELPDHMPASLKVAVSVSKKNFKLAVNRNRIKRLLRETYRLNKQASLENTTKNYALMLLYVGKETPDFHQLDATMKKLLNKFSEQTKN